MVKQQFSKLWLGVRFPHPAPFKNMNTNGPENFPLEEQALPESVPEAKLPGNLNESQRGDLQQALRELMNNSDIT